MGLDELIAKNKKTILKQWFDCVAESYARQTEAFLSREKDRFANPVAGTVTESLEKVLDGICQSADTETFKQALDGIIRVRAVQSFSPSESVAFIFLLKPIIRQLLEKNGAADAKTLSRLDDTISGLALVGFDKYMECREKIYELRAFEIRNRTFKAFERAGLVRNEGPEPAL
ncbi:MAG: RsbRD N-terminal domain-containing protein [Thermodesulfobacteriota bacterium]|nr:RsbRD N-terminal domain-containing protein [Thermodesulfobacteriota bacterium]